MSQELKLIAMFDLKEGAWDQISRTVKECIIQTRKESGNQYYTAHFEKNNHNRIVFIEGWISQEALDLHMKTEHFQNLVKVIESYLEHPMQVLFLNEIEA